jgi:hypothetical protein
LAVETKLAKFAVETRLAKFAVETRLAKLTATILDIYPADPRPMTVLVSWEAK